MKKTILVFLTLLAAAVTVKYLHANMTVMIIVLLFIGVCFMATTYLMQHAYRTSVFRDSELNDGLTPLDLLREAMFQITTEYVHQCSAQNYMVMWSVQQLMLFDYTFREGLYVKIQPDDYIEDEFSITVNGTTYHMSTYHLRHYYVLAREKNYVFIA